MINLKVGSLNVWGLGDDTKRRQVYSWLRKKQLNVYFLQETRCSESKEKLWESEWGYRCYFSCSNRAAQGVQIMMANNFQFNVKEEVKDDLGRYIILHIEVENEDVVLINVYGPNSDDALFFDHLFLVLEEFSQYPFIMGGDFNICLTQLDKKGGRNFQLSHRNARESVIEFMEASDLSDIWRVCNPTERKYTWRQRVTDVACRLDYFLISSCLINIVSKVLISHGFRTDHSFIQIEIEKTKTDRGPGFFKLNTALLLEKNYVDRIKNLIITKKEEYSLQDIAPDLLWEVIKSDVRGESIKYSKNKKRETEKNIKVLEKVLHDLEQIRDTTNDVSINDRIQKLNMDLKEYYDKKTKGTLVRAKVRWLKDGEKNSKYFLGLEKRNYLNKTVNCLKTEDGKEISDFKEVLNEQKRFYSNLYSFKENSLDNEDIVNTFFVANEDIPKLSEEDKNVCEGLITKQECVNAIKNMSNFKSPGTDGLPVEFYKIFWNEISDLLINSFNYSYTQKKMSISQRQGIITLLPKKDKDTKFLKNWRPISLLNTDYKIMTKCIASRLKKVLPRIIHQNQTGFMKDRYIGFNIRLILDLIEYAERENKPGIIFSIDFEKAFDSVSWEFLEKSINYFNFGESFKNWVKLFTTDISSCALNTGWSSGFFKLYRGVRQGCPISPYLFLICAEIFAIGFRNNENIKGIKIEEIEKLLAQFADDTQILLNGTQEVLNEAITLLSLFELLSGMKVNFGKSEVIKIGSTKQENIVPCKEVKFTNDSFKLLGITIPVTGNNQQLIDLNYNPILIKIKGLIKQWTKRTLTLYGKSVIVKTLILPQLIYQLSNLPSPAPTFLQEVDNLIFEFIWDKKRPKIKKSQLYLECSKGGLGIPNITAYSYSLKLKWIKYLADENFESDWRSVFITINKIGKHVYKCNINQQDIKQLGLKGKFWSDVLFSWAKVHYNKYENINFKSTHPKCFLWYNSDIKLQNKTVYYRLWYENDIHYIKDLLDQDSRFLDYEAFKNKYNLDVNYLQYYGFITKIQTKINREGIETNNDVVLNKLLLAKSASKHFYKIILDSINTNAERNCFQYWERITTNEINWEMTFERIYTTTIDIKLRNFQYKLIHNILPDNRLLQKMGVKDDDLCNFCRNTRDSVVHYIWECPTATLYWNNFKIWFESTTSLHINLSLTNVLFGQQYAGDNIQDAFINYIILIAKHYLHCCKWTDTNPSIDIFKENVKKREKVEKEIAFQSGKIEFHNSKWHTLRHIL